MENVSSCNSGMSPVAIVESVSSCNSGMSPVAIVENVSSCVRDVRSLAILNSQEQEQKLERGFEVDLLVDQLGPEDLAVDGVTGGDIQERESQERQRVRAGAERRPGGDLLGEPRAVPPEERQGVQAQLRGPVHTVGGLAADQVPEGDRQSPLNGTK